MYIKVICLFFLFNYAQSALPDLSCEDIAGFVMGHNLARYLLAAGKVENLPAASEMNMMVWDEELAAKAAGLASTYPNTFDADQTTPSGRFPTSQSVTVVTDEDKNSKINSLTLQSMWYNDCTNYTYGPFSEDLVGPTNDPVGHCTQMIWSNSKYLGCAMSEDIEADLKKVYVVCVYGPSANILGQEPYKTGPPSNTLICATDEHRCKYPYGDRCPADNTFPYIRG